MKKKSQFYKLLQTDCAAQVAHVWSGSALLRDASPEVAPVNVRPQKPQGKNTFPSLLGFFFITVSDRLIVGLV